VTRREAVGVGALAAKSIVPSSPQVTPARNAVVSGCAVSHHAARVEVQAALALAQADLCWGVAASATRYTATP
jgi:hypothetical protein